MRSKVSYVFACAGLAAAMGAGCGMPEAGDDPTAQAQSDLYVDSSFLWTIRDIPICWETAGLASVKEWIRDAVADTWEIEGQVRFNGWGACTAGANGIHILLQDALGESNTGRLLDRQTNGMKLNTWATQSCVTGWSQERCVRTTAVHEFAHALAYKHEHLRTSGKPPSCTDTAGTAGNLEIGPWDLQSVTNYCNPLRYNDAHLSGTDIWGYVETYGHPMPLTATNWNAGSMAVFFRGPGNRLNESFTVAGTTWNGPVDDFGAFITSAPSVVSWGTNRMDVFARSGDSSVLHKYWAGSWSAWESLGGVIKGKPVVIAPANNRLEVFARGNDDVLWNLSWTGSQWLWAQLGMDYVGEPAAASWASNRLDVFVRGRDNTLQHNVFTAAGWSGWSSMGGNLASSPSAISWGTGRVDVVARSADDKMFHCVVTATSSSCENVLSALRGTPSATSRGANILEVYTRRDDNALWEFSLSGTNWFTHNLGGLFKGSPEAIAPSNGEVDVFVQGNDDAVWRNVWKAVSGGWSGFLPTGGAIR